MIGRDRYLTTSDVNEIMSNLDQLEAYKCLGRMYNYVDNLEEQMLLRYRALGR